MKRLAKVLIIVTALFSLTACASVNTSDSDINTQREEQSLANTTDSDINTQREEQPLANTSDSKMYIQKAELSEEEQAFAEFVAPEKTPYILDFAVDDTAQSMKINVYELQDGEWESIRCDIGGVDEPKSRLLLDFDNTGLRLGTPGVYGGSSSNETENDSEFEGLTTTVGSFLTDKTAVEYEKEIPLVIQIRASSDDVFVLIPEYGFYEQQTYVDEGYEKVYAVTCMFSQKTVSELSEQTDK